MRLVVEYSIGDGCTYHCITTVPVEYESAEAFIVDLEQNCREMRSRSGWNRVAIELGGQKFDADDFFPDISQDDKFYPPDIFTVDEWFQTNGL